MASNLMRASLARLILRRAFSVSQAARYDGVALTDDPNVNTNFAESIISPLPKGPRLWCTTPELKALKAKEKGDWKNLSEEDMKQLYNAHFGMNVSDMVRNDDTWKTVLGLLMFFCGMTLWVHYTVHTFINPPYAPTVLDQEHINAVVKRMLQEHQGHISGYSSKWDYENNRWKK